jgi:hypothetical protein
MTLPVDREFFIFFFREDSGRYHWMEGLCAFFHTSRFSTGQQLTGGTRAQLGTLITSPFLIKWSNDQEG